MSDEAKKENIDPEWKESDQQANPAPNPGPAELTTIEPSDQEKAELAALYRGIGESRDRLTNLAIQAKMAADLRDQTIAESLSRSQLFEQKYRAIGKARGIDFDDPKNGTWHLDLSTMGFKKG